MYAVMLFQVFHVLQSIEAMLIVAMELLPRRYFKCKFTKTSKHARIIDANVSYVTHKGWVGGVGEGGGQTQLQADHYQPTSKTPNARDHMLKKV